MGMEKLLEKYTIVSTAQQTKRSTPAFRGHPNRPRPVLFCLLLDPPNRIPITSLGGSYHSPHPARGIRDTYQLIQDPTAHVNQSVLDAKPGSTP